ncbi:MAG: hypothetical protein V1776_02250 [Candidatus Diapherotrites archaeon]
MSAVYRNNPPGFYMLTGLFGYSLIFELLVFYFALHLLFQNTPKHWVYLGVGLLALFVLADPSSAIWSELLQGSYGHFWNTLLANVGWR